MKTIYLITFIIIGVVIIWHLGKLFGEAQTRRELKYENLYKEIHNDIYNMPKNHVNRKLIRNKLIELQDMKYNDREKTNILGMNYLIEWGIKPKMQ